MSAIKVQANTTGIGTVTLTAPNTNTDRTVTIPDVSGNVVVSDGSLITADYTSSSLSFGGTVDFTSATVKGLGSWKIQNANNITLVAGDNVFANTRAGALTLNLPASASKGETIRIVDNEGLCSSNNITIGRNGHNIDGSARNAILNVHRQGIVLVYESSRNGWVSKKSETDNPARFQGGVSGYSSGGVDPTPSVVGTIDKFPFAVDANATDVGDLSQARLVAAGQSSQENGYTSGGYSPGRLNTIDKFPFATDTDATDVGNLTQARSTPGGQSSTEYGYSSGGMAPPESNVIDKFPFSTDTNATDVADLTQTRRELIGHSSKVSGYASGGVTGPGAQQNTIDKFPFATNTNATDVGNLIETKGSTAGQSSTEYGYSSGGEGPPSPPRVINTIEKFSFTSDANSTDVGDLTLGRYQPAGQSSIVSGYTSGGLPLTDTIDKFPFAVDTNATDVGNLSQTRRGSAGQQV